MIGKLLGITESIKIVQQFLDIQNLGDNSVSPVLQPKNIISRLLLHDISTESCAKK